MSYASPTFEPKFSQTGNTSAFLDDSDLLDLNNMQSPNVPAAQLWTGNNQNSHSSMADAAAASIGFSTTPSQPILTPHHANNFVGSPNVGSFGARGSNIANSALYGSAGASTGIPFGATPPVPESTSPFDEFMLNRNFKQLKSGAVNNKKVNPSSSSNSPVQNGATLAANHTSPQAASSPQQQLWLKQRQMQQLHQLQQQQQQQQQQQHQQQQHGGMVGSPSHFGMTQLASPPSSNSPFATGGVPVPGASSSGGFGAGDLRASISSPPHALRFLQDNGLGSGTSSPVGSYGSQHELYGFGLSPSTKPPTMMGGGFPGSVPATSNAASTTAPGTSPNASAKPTTIPRVTKNSGNAAGSAPKSLDDPQNMLLAERRRRRRESHNAVERRRRDNINEKIQELASLVPESMLYNQNDTSPSAAAGGTNTLTKDGRPNKGTILTKSVEYIRNLQNVIDEQNQRELEMQELVQQLQRQLGIEVTEFKHTSAELLLARIRGASGGNDYDNEPELILTGPQGHTHIQQLPDVPMFGNDGTPGDNGTSETSSGLDQIESSLLINQSNKDRSNGTGSSNNGSNSVQSNGTPLGFTPDYQDVGDLSEYEQTAEQFLVS